MTTFEVRYDDAKGRYTEETFTTQAKAWKRVAELKKKGIEAEVWEVTRSR